VTIATAGDRVWEVVVVAERSDPVEVLSGLVEPDLRWYVMTSGDDRNLLTMLHVYRGDEKLIGGTGFDGPPLDANSLMSEYRGRKGDLPWFVMARTAPMVDRVVATTDQGTEVTLELSPPIQRFGLRFAVAALPDGERPGSIRVERDGVVLHSQRQSVPLGPPFEYS
jgi:hypothetical protein